MAWIEIEGLFKAPLGVVEPALRLPNNAAEAMGIGAGDVLREYPAANYVRRFQSALVRRRLRGLEHFTARNPPSDGAGSQGRNGRVQPRDVRLQTRAAGTDRRRKTPTGLALRRGCRAAWGSFAAAAGGFQPATCRCDSVKTEGKRAFAAQTAKSGRGEDAGLGRRGPNQSGRPQQPASRGPRPCGAHRAWR